jgi:hypothetical protein
MAPRFVEVSAPLGDGLAWALRSSPRAAALELLHWASGCGDAVRASATAAMAAPPRGATLALLALAATAAVLRWALVCTGARAVAQTSEGECKKRV